ncbi:uncharacterized protein EV420DRAFT_1636453 [Desarmillaria tabescens]|uniref:Uncharacterized protein n=1 Tax=Armillaria tabescens TaxID=1929756 RepID=A0AA39NHS6_ARMTA|nr:uncharacterized protein EV420DRAFT_1636453 [Desarmillaria tabescens]KAK0465891.1 hypothetical protein EV420DRAFT_1636453 [Desarmillaria tabescens]
MATAQTSIPPDLTDADKAIIFQVRDEELNSTVLYSLLSGVYTGVVAITLWSIFTNKAQPIRRSMALVVVLLHIVTMLNFGFVWSYISSMFIRNGSNFWTEYLFWSSSNVMLEVGIGTTGIVCTILADSTMIIRCWMVWGRRWLPILLPTFVLTAAIVFKIIATYKLITDPDNSYYLFFILYTSFVLATTLWCTLLIVYRIIAVARAGRETGGGPRAYRNIIEILVESSALYSVSLILYVVFIARDSLASGYFDVLAGIARGVAPTLLVGRVAAGHSRPDDSWKGSVISGSLRFGSRPGGRLSRSQQDSMMSDDLEAQHEGDGN